MEQKDPLQKLKCNISILTFFTELNSNSTESEREKLTVSSAEQVIKKEEEEEEDKL